MKFNPEDKILVLDFDHTCYDTDDFLFNEIRQPMLKQFKIPIDIWEQSYKEAVKVGYSLEQHRQELIKLMGSEPFSLEEIQTFGKNIKFSGYLYEDVVSSIKQAKEKGYKIMLLSFGDSHWQDLKVFGSGINELVDVINYLTKELGKAEILKETVGNCKKVIFIDNKGIELDIVQKTIPFLETYHINRVPNEAMNAGQDEDLRIKYLESRMVFEESNSLNHKHCCTLQEIQL